MEELYQNEVQISGKAELRLIPEGENFRRKDELVDENTVRSTFAIRQSATEPRYEKQTTFDFSGVTREQLMLLCCTNGVVVWAQRVLRDMGEGMVNPAELSVVSVLEDVIEGSGTRATVSPEDRARRALSKLDPETRAAILASFQDA